MLGPAKLFVDIVPADARRAQGVKANRLQDGSGVLCSWFRRLILLLHCEVSLYRLPRRGKQPARRRCARNGRIPAIYAALTWDVAPTFLPLVCSLAFAGLAVNAYGQGDRSLGLERSRARQCRSGPKTAGRPSSRKSPQSKQ